MLFFDKIFIWKFLPRVNYLLLNILKLLINVWEQLINNYE